MIILTDSCPICNSKNIDINNIEYDLPKIGKSILYVFKCNDCNYKSSEIIPLTEKDPVRIEIKVDNKDKFKKIILRSPYAIINLKEIEMDIYPGIDSKFEIKAVDDFINSVKDKLEEIKILYHGEEYNKVIEKIKYLEEVLENKKELTIIIDDEKGYSTIYNY
ncbi:zinc finger protein [Nanobdella aerobiophila]|uniref:Zinc finger protein n=1 Tax=Nanobdella aerobiophila TaxID=2586965 RepID=A0A915WSY4_9ARCH|nr:ZPR1 zinc finger domain-containing protein [Nanobdella aerobiophila]BBL45790.1 zinc finger protein [Nanobdella aerobiophila]